MLLAAQDNTVFNGKMTTNNEMERIYEHLKLN